MDRVKTFMKYAIWIILFFVFSELLINVGLNSSYKDIQRKDNIEQIKISQAQATLVNGKISGKIQKNELTNKYVKIDLYSKRDKKVGAKYIEIEKLDNTLEQEFNIYFELEDVTSYEISLVDKKEDQEIKLFTTEMSRAEILAATIFTLVVFW